MMQGLKELFDYKVQAVDGNIGQARDFYFDSFEWVVRYLAVDLEGHHARQVLLSPLAFKKPDIRQKALPIVLNKEMVMNSPDVNVEQPISRQQEIELHNYYQWPFYWSAGGLVAYPLVELETEMRENDALPVEEDNPHLHSVREVLDYRIQARDGEIGHMHDFIVEDTTWKIQYIAINTGTWFPGRKVIISPQWIKMISWPDALVIVDLSKETIKNSPEYDPSVPLDEEYQNRLSEYYKQGR